MRIAQRKRVFLDVIPFPATKSTAGTLTILGDEIAPFENNSGTFNVHLIAADSSKITNTMTIKANVSYDEGETWTEVASFTDLKNGSGKVSVLKTNVLKSAPRIRLDAVFTSAARLAEGHGCKVYVEVVQGEEEEQRFFRNTVAIPATIETKAVTGAKATLEVAPIAPGSNVTISKGEIVETYNNIDVATFPDLVNAGNLVALTTGSGTNLLFTAKADGVAGNGIDITDDGTSLGVTAGGVDGKAKGTVTVSSSKFITGSVKKVVVTSNSGKKASGAEIFQYTLMSSFNGKAWWAVGDPVAIDNKILEKEYTSKLGTCFKIDFKAEDIDITGHNAKIDLLVYYR